LGVLSGGQVHVATHGLAGYWAGEPGPVGDGGIRGRAKTREAYFAFERSGSGTELEGRQRGGDCGRCGARGLSKFGKKTVPGPINDGWAGIAGPEKERTIISGTFSSMMVQQTLALAGRRSEGGSSWTGRAASCESGLLVPRARKVPENVAAACRGTREHAVTALHGIRGRGELQPSAFFSLCLRWN